LFRLGYEVRNVHYGGQRPNFEGAGIRPLFCFHCSVKTRYPKFTYMLSKNKISTGIKNNNNNNSKHTNTTFFYTSNSKEITHLYVRRQKKLFPIPFFLSYTAILYIQIYIRSKLSSLERKINQKKKKKRPFKEVIDALEDESKEKSRSLLLSALRSCGFPTLGLGRRRKIKEYLTPRKIGQGKQSRAGP
jgi:hypothetical protein